MGVISVYLYIETTSDKELVSSRKQLGIPSTQTCINKIITDFYRQKFPNSGHFETFILRERIFSYEICIKSKVVTKFVAIIILTIFTFTQLCLRITL